MRAQNLDGLKARLRSLRPVVDADLELIACDCPECGAQDSDPLGLYRPLQVIPRGSGILFRCGACGGEHDA